jgi:hypothetical protein
VLPFARDFDGNVEPLEEEVTFAFPTIVVLLVGFATLLEVDPVAVVVVGVGVRVAVGVEVRVVGVEEVGVRMAEVGVEVRVVGVEEWLAGTAGLLLLLAVGGTLTKEEVFDLVSIVLVTGDLAVSGGFVVDALLAEGLATFVLEVVVVVEVDAALNCGLLVLDGLARVVVAVAGFIGVVLLLVIDFIVVLVASFPLPVNLLVIG